MILPVSQLPVCIRNLLEGQSCRHNAVDVQIVDVAPIEGDFAIVVDLFADITGAPNYWDLRRYAPGLRGLKPGLAMVCGKYAKGHKSSSATVYMAEGEHSKIPRRFA